ncbi:hypothetical protein SAMD00019534_052070 [Acytostelium subglobosum LB1]|uniref:hypothetical protein n=1 Tax=Acytostelium subglobosum LB1 TaxID=1410327 RepID=UPI000644F993|nr:hypothetical protein SAMD00019534_052070 [Acytostelium subglobosum LB1]GAM22032.1 hypothetical protein SAMD00019534_052070 [Acytostelium subglobosum LB1]|eukprot:XP_012755132.1 hypothetical protein SAMD00019534_052070 [Acytostelium subglobosum LB1]
MIDIDQYLDFGFPVDQIKFFICMMASYPFAMILKRLPNANMKHILSIVLGITYCSFSLGAYSWVHSLISSTVVYILVNVLPRRVAHIYVFVFAMGYMSASHWYRMYVDYMGWTMDFTAPQMVLTLKLTSFAWNLYDGSRPVAELSADEKKRSIKKIPTLLEFYGFVYYFPTFLAGPTIEIGDYLRYTSGEMFSEFKTIPSSGFAALKTFVLGLLCFPILTLGGTYTVAYLFTPEFAMEPLYLRVFRMWFHIVLSRFKYYFGWYVSEGSAILSGMSYNGLKDGVPTWDRLTNVVPLKVELASNIRDVSTYWNMGTADWLKTYVYLRLAPAGTKPSFKSTIGTYAVSAFWHGFYPGYYIFFVLSAFLTEVAKDIRRKIRPYFVSGPKDTPIQPFKLGYDIIGSMITAWFLNFYGASFLILSFDKTLVLWRSFSFMPPIILVGSFFILRFLVPTPKSQKVVTKYA